MKAKMKKLSVSAIVLALVLALTAIFAACGENGPTPPSPTPGGDPGDATVTELFIDTPPNVTEYYIGEAFDPTGMKVKAKWSDGVKLTVPLSDCTISPSGALQSGDNKITVSYGGKSAVQEIRIIDEEIDRITVDTGNTVLRAAVNTPIDLSGVVVSAHYADGSSRVVSAGYTFEADGKPVENVSALSFAEWGEHTVTVLYGDKKAEIKIRIFDGFIVEAENILSEPEETDRNYVEIYAKSPSGSPTAISKPNEPASGDGYMGSVFNGSVIRFHVYAEEACNADVILRASSAYMLKDGGSWSPVEMGEQQFNRLFEVSYGSAAEAESGSLKELRVGDDVVLEGGKTENPAGDPLLYVNWKDVNFGTLALEAGDNIIELNVITDYINCRSENVACNIDRLEIQYTDEEADETLTVESLEITNAPTKTEYLSGQKFEPAGMTVEASMSNGTKENVDLSKCAIDPSGALTTADTFVTITYRGKSVKQQIKVTPAASVVIEGENLIKEPAASDKNYVEAVRNGYQGVIAAGDTEAPGVADTSGGKYLKGLFGVKGEKPGAVVRFHIWSETACKAEIKIFVSSCDVKTSGDGNAWHPSEMNGVQFNKVFKVSFGSADSLNDVKIGDGVYVEGGKTEDGSVSMALWENWREITLGTFDLSPGDNVLELENINSTLKNLAGEIYGMNVDRLVVNFM